MTREDAIYWLGVLKTHSEKRDAQNITEALNMAIEALQTENSSEKPNNCKYAENPSGDVWECGCFLDTYCEHQIYDRNPDRTINIVKCGYEPKTEPQRDIHGITDCDFCKHGSEDWDSEACDGCCENNNHFEPKDEPQYDIDKGTIKCDNCSENGSYKCTKCDGEMYFKRLAVEDEPQKCSVNGRPYSECFSCEHFKCTADEPQTDCPCNTCANKGDHDGECQNCVADSAPIRWKTPSHYKPKQTDCPWK